MVRPTLTLECRVEVNIRMSIREGHMLSSARLRNSEDAVDRHGRNLTVHAVLFPWIH